MDPSFKMPDRTKPKRPKLTSSAVHLLGQLTPEF
jgi:hypothetical protein